MQSPIADQLRDLEQRVRVLEDEAAIQRLLVAYGFAVDTGDVEAMLDGFAEDVTVRVDGNWVMHGHEQAREIVEGSVHQGFLPLCAHNVGPFTVAVDGDTAVATGYSRVYLRTDAGFRVERVSFNRWELTRGAEGWKVSVRHTALLGVGDAAHNLLRRGLPDSTAG
jgi:ketosteroid isomerase-like protein